MENRVEELLRNCAKEPIHAPGAIQSAGTLIVVEKQAGTISHIAENVSDWFDGNAQQLLGKPLTAIWSEQLISDINTQQIVYTHSPALDQQVSISLESTESHRFYQVEPYREHESLAAKLTQAIESISTAHTSQELIDELVIATHRLNGFGHTMFYRFDHNWNGQVLAEYNELDQPNYLGLHFPHADIPPQARMLYKQYPVRVIFDATSNSVPLLTDSGSADIDISVCGLRAVSPAHIRYLNNMPVTASMSMSIIIDDKLYGLVACHHDKPVILPARWRKFCAMFASQASARLNVLLAAESQNLADQNQHILTIPFLAARERRPLPSVLKENLDEFNQLLETDSATLCIGSSTYSSDNAPDEATIKFIIQYLDAHPTLQHEGVWFSDNIASHIPTLAGNAKVAGVLAIDIAENMRLLMVRQPAARKVNWGGDVSSTAAVKNEDGSETLKPRASFEQWQQELKDHSQEWSSNTLYVSRVLRSNLVESSVAASAAEAAHQQGKSDMANMILHDLGNCLVGINGQISHLRKSVEQAPFAKQLPKLQVFLESKREQLATALGSKTDSLLSLVDTLSTAALEQHSNTNAHLQNLLRGITHATELIDIQRTYGSKQSSGSQRHYNLVSLLKDFHTMLDHAVVKRGGNIEINTPDDIPKITIDRSRLLQVLLNLGKNACEAFDAAEQETAMQLKITVSHNSDGAIIAIQDNGIGFAPEDAPKLFLDGISSKGRNSGVGLAGCKRIIEDVGGSLLLISNGHMQGATAEIHLPADMLK